MAPLTTRSLRSQVWYFARVSCVFLLGLVGVLFVFERAATRRIEATDGQSLMIRDVYPLPGLARSSPSTVERVYLGDSVARQFYPAGSEPNNRLRFLTNNGGLSLAGNYYLLEDVFRASPAARDAVLMVRPETLQTNIDVPYASDFFCGLFHSARHVLDVFRAKKDLRVTSIHVGRWLLSGTMAINGAWRQEPEAFVRPFFERMDATVGVMPVDPVEREPLLKWLNYLWGGAADWTPVFAARDTVTDVLLSPVSAVYLEKMRALCASRGGTLRVLSTPYPSDLRWNNRLHIFSAPIFYLPPEDFGDTVHVGPPKVWLPSQVGTQVARRLAEAYGLVEDLAVNRAGQPHK